jgi:hypothetical protein
VLVAVVTTMFSTALTVIDGFPRAIARTFAVMRAAGAPVTGESDTGIVYRLSGAILGVLTVAVVAMFAGNLTTLVDFATIVSFLTGPLLGYLNLRVVLGANVPREHQPGRALLALSYAGLALLGGTAVVYVASLVSGK